MKICPECCNQPYPDTKVTCPVCEETLVKVEGKPKAEKKKLEAGEIKLRLKYVLYVTLGILFFLGSLFVMWINLPDSWKPAKTVDTTVVPPTTPPEELAPQVEVPVVIPGVIDPSTVQMTNRYFTQHGFSVVVNPDYLVGKEIYLAGDLGEPSPDYSKLQEEILRYSQELLQGSVQSPLHSSWTLYETAISWAADVVLTAYQGTSMEQSLEEFMENSVIVMEESFSVADGVSSHVAITLLHNPAEPVALDLFQLPVPEGEGFFQVAVVGGETNLDKVAYLPLLETMHYSYISDHLLMEYDSSTGKAKMLSSAFSMWYQPTYFQKECIPYYQEPLWLENEVRHTLPFILGEDSGLTGMALQIQGSLGSTALPQVTGTSTVAGKEFSIWEQQVTLGEETLSVILGISYSSSSYPSLYGDAYVLFDQAGPWEFTREEVIKLNEVFQTIMETYEEAVAPSLLALLGSE